jgi:Tol biopolymer transport system component
MSSRTGRAVGVALVVTLAACTSTVGGSDASSPAASTGSTDVVGQPSQSSSTTGTGTTSTFTSGFIGYIDLTTGETSVTEIFPHNSAIDVSSDGTRIAYTDGGVVIADLDGSNAQVLEETRGDPTGAQWSPDGSSIVYQDGAGLYVVDVDSGQVRRIADLDLATADLSYVSPTFDPTGTAVMFNQPTAGGDRERYGLWSVPVNGGEPTLVRRKATFGDYSPDGTRIAFVEDGGFGDLFVAPAAGGKAQKLATGSIVVPRWSPDGTRIAYNDGSGGVYVVDVATGEPTLVVESDHLPAWVDDDTLSLSP